MTTLPLWAVFTIAFGSPVLAFAGVVVAQLVIRRGAGEVEVRSKREETMRTLRWAAELAVSADERMASLGVAELIALLDSTLLDDPEKQFVEAALDAVYEDSDAEIEALGPGVEVRQLSTSNDPSTAGDLGPGVRLGQERDGGDANG